MRGTAGVRGASRSTRVHGKQSQVVLKDMSHIFICANALRDYQFPYLCLMPTQVSTQWVVLTVPRTCSLIQMRRYYSSYLLLLEVKKHATGSNSLG